MPLISVLLPEKNAETTLAAAVRSTLRALPRDSEVVVLDDGSSDETATVASSLRDKRPRVVRNAHSVGVGAGLSQLVDLTDSEFVARVDGDDTCLPGRFRVQLHDVRHGADFTVTPALAFRTSPVRVRPGLPLPISADAMPLLLVVRGLRLVRGSLPFIGYRQHDDQLSAQASFTGAAFAESRLRQSYSSFVPECFGVDPTWLDAFFRPEATPDSTEELLALAALVNRHARRLSAGQRLVLSRTTRREDRRTLTGSARQSPCRW